jgi:hypothetical protein
VAKLHRSVLFVAVVVLAGCTMPPLTTPTPRATPTPAPDPTPTAAPTPMAEPTADPTPDPEVPHFDAGEIIATATDGLRVRQRPGRSSVVVTDLLPLGAELQVVMGPIPSDGFGWYLVTDADPAEPQFREGWIAAGYEPDPFLRSTGRTADETPLVAGFALTGDAEYGPIEISDEHHAIRWIATDPERRRCTFSVALEPAGGDPVTAIRATIGSEVVPGTLQPTFFAAQPDVRGQLFVSITSDCAWALAVLRVPPPSEEPDADDEDG